MIPPKISIKSQLYELLIAKVSRAIIIIIIIIEEEEEKDLGKINSCQTAGVDNRWIFPLTPQKEDHNRVSGA